MLFSDATVAVIILCVCNVNSLELCSENEIILVDTFVCGGTIVCS